VLILRSGAGPPVLQGSLVCFQQRAFFQARLECLQNSICRKQVFFNGSLLGFHFLGPAPLGGQRILFLEQTGSFFFERH